MFTFCSDEMWREYSRQINVSEGQGFDIVRTKVKAFVSLAAPREPPHFRLLILDEIDNLCQEAQGALRRLMETGSATTRFVLISNSLAGIIPPLRSRCSMHRFVRISPESFLACAMETAAREAIPMGAEAAEVIYASCRGDLRRATILMHGLKFIFRLPEEWADIPTVAEVATELAGGVPSDLITQFVDGILGIEPLAVAGKPKTAHQTTRLVELCESVESEGFNVLGVLDDIFEVLLARGLPDVCIAHAAEALAVAEFRLTAGAGGIVQLLNACLTIHTFFRSVVAPSVS